MLSEKKATKKTSRIASIQEAAKKLFFEKSFANTTMEAIAKEVNISKGTVYLYFQNKDELYISLMIPVMEELGRYYATFFDQVILNSYLDKTGFMKALYELHLKAYEYDADGLKIIMAFQQGNLFSTMSKETRSKINNCALNNYFLLRSSLKKAMDNGIITQKDPIKLADIIWGTYIGVVQLEESKLKATDKDHIKETLRFAFEILSDGL